MDPASASLGGDDPAATSPTDLGVTPDVLACIVNAITNPVFVKDEQHRFVLVNDAFGAFLGRARGSARPQRLRFRASRGGADLLGKG